MNYKHNDQKQFFKKSKMNISDTEELSLFLRRKKKSQNVLYSKSEYSPSSPQLLFLEWHSKSVRNIKYYGWLFNKQEGVSEFTSSAQLNNKHGTQYAFHPRKEKNP